MKQLGFFDVEERFGRLSGLGDQLEAFSRTVDFEVFRADLDRALVYAGGNKGGRPPFDRVLMFKILVLQTLNNLSDERTEYLINDRLSCMHFLRLGLSDHALDAKTVWLCRERLTQAGAIPPKKDRKSKPPYNWHLYKKRHLIESMFAKLKDWRRVATRYDRCAHTFMSAIHIAASVIFYLKE